MPWGETALQEAVESNPHLICRNEMEYRVLQSVDSGRSAQVSQSACPDRHNSDSSDAALAEVIESWGSIPPLAKQAILTIARSAPGGTVLGY